MIPATMPQWSRSCTLIEVAIGVMPQKYHSSPLQPAECRLQQVIWNLLSHAIKFTPAGGQVQMILERVESHASLQVSDTGIGIRPEFLPFVFERFRQEQKTTARYGGLGLGLAITRHLVELHGGTITVASFGEGQGATFTVTLPLVEPILKDS